MHLAMANSYIRKALLLGASRCLHGMVVMMAHMVMMHAPMMDYRRRQMVQPIVRILRGRCRCTRRTLCCISSTLRPLRSRHRRGSIRFCGVGCCLCVFDGFPRGATAEKQARPEQSDQRSLQQYMAHLSIPP